MNRSPLFMSLAATLCLGAIACGSSSVPEVPDEPYTPEDEKAAVIGPGPDSTEVEGVAYPTSEQRDGYGDTTAGEAETEAAPQTEGEAPATP